MSKLAIVLCAVLVASAANASYVSDALVSAQAKVEEIIGTIIYTTKHKFDIIKTKAEEHDAKVEAAAKLSNENAFLQINSTLEEVQMAIDKLALKDDGEIADFNKLVSHLEKTGFSVIVNMSGCVDDKLATGREHIQNIITLSENVIANLTAIRDEGRHCGDNVVDLKTAAAGIHCGNMARLKAAWVETKAVPSVIIEMTKISNSLASFQLALVHCEITGGFPNFFDERTLIFIKIHQMKHGARPDTEKVETEKSRLNTQAA